MAKRKAKSKLPIRDWRVIPDQILLARNIKGSVFDAAESLRPNETTMLNYCSPKDKSHARAIAIINSYHGILAPVVYVDVLP